MGQELIAGPPGFRPLGEDGPEAGIFFVEADPYPVSTDNQLATGIVGLISPDGLAVSCAHVLLAVGRIPGSVVSLYGADPRLPIVVEAEVLEQGWRGPDWRAWRGSEWEGRNILELVDQRPDLFAEDVALLRLRPDTACWDRARLDQPAGDAAAALMDRARVLPLGIPGYRHASATPLKAWHVAWEACAPFMRAMDAAFLGIEPRLHGIVRFRSEHIGPGCSGSPLWDPARHRMVGMVRRGIRRTVPDTVLGVDARVVSRFSSVATAPDAQAGQLLAVLERIAGENAPLKHFPLLASLAAPRLLELRVCIPSAKDVLDEEAAVEDGMPAIPTLLRQLASNPVVVLSGGAGSGKSTLLHSLAAELLRQGVLVGDRRLVPVPIRVVDFQKVGFDIRALLDAHAARYAWDAGPGSVIDVFELNDLVPVILLDGLDEIDRTARGQVLGRLAAATGAQRAARILVATRPIDDLRVAGGRTLQGWPVLNLLHLTDADLRDLSALWFEAAEERDRFTDMLATTAWDSRGPAPLQLAAAASLFRSSRELPARPVDLPFRLVEHLLKLGSDASKIQLREGRLDRSRSDERSLGHLQAILRRLGRFTVDGAVERPDVLAALKDAQEPWADDPAELIRFLQRETTLLGGVLAFEPLDEAGWRLAWPHRTIAETLAAEDMAEAHAFKPIEALGAFLKTLRSQGQGFAISLLAALDRRREGGAAAVELVLTRALSDGASDYNSTLLAVRALGAEIRVGDELRRRLVRTLIALLLMPEGARLGVMKCSDIFTTDDMPQPLEIARRVALRPAIIEQLHERWRLRDPRRRGGTGPLYVSAREAILLDRLAMWSDIDIPVAKKEEPISHASERFSSSPVIRKESDVASSEVSVALLSHVFSRLREDADGFLAGLISFAREHGEGKSETELTEAYLSNLIWIALDNRK